MKNFEILSSHYIYVDHYEDGEGDQVNYFTLKSTHEANDYKEAVNNHLEFYGYNLGIENCEIDKENNVIQTSCLVNASNEQPSNKDVEIWKRGDTDLTLYSDNISITVKQLIDVEF